MKYNLYLTAFESGLKNYTLKADVSPAICKSATLLDVIVYATGAAETDNPKLAKEIFSQLELYNVEQTRIEHENGYKMKRNNWLFIKVLYGDYHNNDNNGYLEFSKYVDKTPDYNVSGKVPGFDTNDVRTMFSGTLEKKIEVMFGIGLK